MSWDPFQREVLAELGLQPWVQAAARADEDARGATSAPMPAEAQGLPSPRLLAALARAAGTDAGAIAALPALQGFRPGPAAKRALWPVLRRLRAQAR